MNTSRRRFALIAATVAAVMIGVGVGVAFWTTTSPVASGSAPVGTAEQVIISQINTPITALTPGGTAQPIDINIANPATFPQKVSQVRIAVASVTLAASPPAGDADGLCPVGEFTVVPASPISLTGPNTTIAASGNQDFLSVATIRLTETGANQNACQGATVNLELEVVS